MTPGILQKNTDSERLPPGLKKKHDPIRPALMVMTSWPSKSGGMWTVVLTATIGIVQSTTDSTRWDWSRTRTWVEFNIIGKAMTPYQAQFLATHYDVSRADYKTQYIHKQAS